MIAVLTIPRSYSSAFMAYAVEEKGMRVGKTMPSQDPERYPLGTLEHAAILHAVERHYGGRITLYDLLKHRIVPDVDFSKRIKLGDVDIIKMPIHYFKVLEYYDPEKWVITHRDPTNVAGKVHIMDDGHLEPQIFPNSVDIMGEFLLRHPETELIDMDKFMAGDKSHADRILGDGRTKTQTKAWKSRASKGRSKLKPSWQTQGVG